MLNIFSRSTARSTQGAASTPSAQSAQSAQADYLRKFLDNKEENLFLGSFESLDAARAAIPAESAVGYDHEAAARSMYSHQICAWDYAPLFWLLDAFHGGSTTVFDLGGHIGIKYYAFRRVIAYPQALHWRVCDLPGVIKVGQELAIEREAIHQLSFGTEISGAEDADVLLLSGSLQYLPLRISEILARLQNKPRRLILNITAVHDERTMYTLNSIGHAVCPYRIQHRDELLGEIRDAGYRRRDVWRNDSKPICIPFVDGGNDAYYFGCCFDRRGVS